MRKQGEIRDILKVNKLQYYLKVFNSISGKGHRGNFGINMEYSYEYTFYVKKKDYDEALRLIN